MPPAPPPALRVRRAQRMISSDRRSALPARSALLPHSLDCQRAAPVRRAALLTSPASRRASNVRLAPRNSTLASRAAVSALLASTRMCQASQPVCRAWEAHSRRAMALSPAQAALRAATSPSLAPLSAHSAQRARRTHSPHRRRALFARPAPLPALLAARLALPVLLDTTKAHPRRHHVWPAALANLQTSATAKCAARVPLAPSRRAMPPLVVPPALPAPLSRRVGRVAA